MKLVIAEKPSVGKELASFLGANQKKEGYCEGNGYLVSWAYGHLLELKSFKEHGFDDDWNIEKLPFIPKNYLIKLKDDSGVRKQYNILSELFNKASEVICATDAGREGELIFRYIYLYVKSTKPIKRLWVSSLTQEALRKAFNNLQPGEEFQNLFNAAVSRNQADYLVGLNATIALTSKTNCGTLSLGRVQTPTLAMICDRFNENQNFISTPYYQLRIQVVKNDIPFFSNSVESWENKETAKEQFSKIEKLDKVIINNVEKNIKNESPPLLFDLTTLQQEANKKYGFTANQTLDIAQELYENKFITYPRTGSCYIGEDLFPEIKNLINCLGNYTHNKFNEVPKKLLEQQLNSKSVNSEKVTDHHALLITENIPKQFADENSKLIYELISIRFLEAFSDVCVKEITKIKIKVDALDFITSGVIIKKVGWRLVSFNEQSNNEETILPDVDISETLKKTDTIFIESFTKPKPFHTEASLLNAMETCGKNIEGDELKEALKENGIGTPATRASIIEVLIKRNYIYREKKNLLPTIIGLQVYQAVKDMDISKAELTGVWENKLLKMERGNYNYSDFQNEINNYITDLIKIIKDKEIVINSVSIGTCPNCSGNILENSKSFYCENVRNEKCNFPTLWKNISNKKIPYKEIQNLLSNHTTSLIKGFKNKDKRVFNAKIVIIENELKFDFSTPEIASCPKCKSGKIKENEKSFSCDQYKITGCNFNVWKEICNKKISTSILLTLLKGEKTQLIKGFKGKEKNFDAHLKMDNEYKIIFLFK